MYAAAIHRHSPTALPPRAPIPPALTGCSPANWPLPPGAAGRLPSRAIRTRQPCSQPTIVFSRGDRHMEGTEGAMRFRFVRRCPGGVPSPWVAPPAGSAVCWTTWCSPKAQDRVKVRPGAVADALTAP